MAFCAGSRRYQWTYLPTPSSPSGSSAEWYRSAGRVLAPRVPPVNHQPAAAHVKRLATPAAGTEIDGAVRHRQPGSQESSASSATDAYVPQCTSASILLASLDSYRPRCLTPDCRPPHRQSHAGRANAKLAPCTRHNPDNAWPAAASRRSPCRVGPVPVLPASDVRPVAEAWPSTRSTPAGTRTGPLETGPAPVHDLRISGRPSGTAACPAPARIESLCRQTRYDPAAGHQAAAQNELSSGASPYGFVRTRTSPEE